MANIDKRNGRANNSMDVRAKQRLCFQRLSLNLGELSGGFAPRHLKRCPNKHQIELSLVNGRIEKL